MQKAFVKKDPPWVDLPSIDTPIIAAELNRIEDGVDTIDSRVVTMDTTKANQVDLLECFKAITFDTATGTFTFTRWDGTTVPINTDIEKIAVNFDYDDDPTSAHYQNLVLTLSDGTVKYVDLSALITEFEFTDSATIGFTVSSSGEVTASVKNGSITAEKLQPNYLADVTAQANAAAGSATAAAGSVLDSEAWANGTRNGSDVPSTDPAYHNNSKYWKDQAQAIASGSISGLSDVDIDTPTLANGQVLTYVSSNQMWENKNPEVTRLKSLDMVGKTTTFNADGSISIVADDYSEDITFNANGTITDAVTINNVTTVKTIVFNGSTIDEILGTAKVPNMTYNNVPSGKVTGSSKWSDTYDYWKAFNDGNNAWGSASNQLTDQWLDYEFASAVKVNSVIWENRKDSNEIMPPKNYKIQASNDGTNYVDLTPIITNSNSEKGAKHYVSFANDTAYTHYRFFAIDLLDTGSSARFIAIGKIQYYGQ